MSKLILSEEQRDAAECLDQNVLLFAGAGCGKTATLVERVVNILENGHAISDIVAITFTEKAANELKGRLRKRLRELADEAADDEGRRFWRGHLLAMDSAEVGTIHGFCSRILREFPVEAGVDPEFAVMEEGESARLRDAAVQDALFAAVTGGDAAALRFLERMELSALEGSLVASVGRRETIDAFMRVLGADGVDAARMAGALRVRAEAVLLQALVESLSRDEYVKAVSVLEDTPGPPGDKMEEKRLAFLEGHKKLLGVSDDKITQHIAALIAIIGELRGGSKAKWGGKLGIVTHALGEARKLLKGADALSKGIQRENWDERAADALEFVALHRRVLEAYTAAKRREAALDFDDLVVLARNVLRDSARIAAATAKRCGFLLVDEFQDTDHVQEEMVRHLEAKGSNVFVVGDPEQSIYRFRGAEVEVFKSLQQAYATSGRGTVKSLAGNRRSVSAIVSFVDALFSRSAQAGSGQPIWRTPHRRLVAMRKAQGGHVEIMLAASGEGKYRARQIEAEAIATRIGEMVASDSVQVFDREGGVEVPRRPSYGDIAILFRALSDVTIYEAALHEAGIPFYTVAGRTFYARPEVKDLVNLLRVIVDADDSLSLVGALRSPLFAVSDDYLTVLALARPLPDYFDGAETPGDGPDAVAFARAAALVKELRAFKNRLSARELVDRILDATGYAAAVAGLYLGAQRTANVLALRNAAAAFDEQGRGSPEDFVAYVSEMEISESRESEAVIEAEGSGSVRLMTIHQAKGLEFPVTIAADMGRGRNKSYPVVSVDRDLGIAVEPPEGEGGSYRDVMRWADDDRDAAEALRLLYVAATRAKDHLILSGCATIKEAEKDEAADEGEEEAKEEIAAEGWMAQVIKAMGLNAAKPGLYDFGEVSVELSVLSALPRKHKPRKPAILDLRDAILSGEALPDGLPADAEETLARVAPIAGGAADFDRFTATQIGDFCRCPLKFELAHLRRLPPDWILADEPPITRVPANVVGTVLHAVLERTRPGEPLAAALERVIAADPSYERNAERLREACAPVLDSLAASAFYRRIAATAGERERLFSFLLGDCLMEGKMDLVIDGEIVDYKSDEVSAEDARQHAERYRAQMDVYALAYERLKGAAPRKVSVFFLRPAVAVEWEYGSEGIAAAALRVQATIDAVRGGPPYPPRRLEDCRCEFGSLCAAVHSRRSSQAPGPRR